MAQYSSFAREFGKTRDKLFWSEIPLIFEFVYTHANTSPKSILDIGCGSGRVFQWMNTGSFELDSLVGIDPCRELLDIACSRDYRYDHIQWQEGSFESLEDIHLDPFDLVIAIASFHHVVGLDVARSAVCSLWNSIVPGGYFAMTNWNLLHTQYQGKYGKYRVDENQQTYYDIPFSGNIRRYVAWDIEGIDSLFDTKYWDVLYSSATPENEKNIITIVQKKYS